MSVAAPEALPPIAVLVVEDRARAAEQLAQLLRFWGAAAAHAVPGLDEVAAFFEHHSGPALVLLDHRLQGYTGVEVALWLAARPALRRRLCVAAYTNADEVEILESLRELVRRLGQDTTLTHRLLGDPSGAEHLELEQFISAAHTSDAIVSSLYHRLYDAHLSKRLSMNQLREAVDALARTLPRSS